MLNKYWNALFSLLWGSHPNNATQHCVRNCCELRPESPLDPLKELWVSPGSALPSSKGEVALSSSAHGTRAWGQ